MPLKNSNDTTTSRMSDMHKSKYYSAIKTGFSHMHDDTRDKKLSSDMSYNNMDCSSLC